MPHFLIQPGCRAAMLPLSQRALLIYHAEVSTSETWRFIKRDHLRLWTRYVFKIILYNLISVLFSFMDSPVERQEKKQQEQKIDPWHWCLIPWEFSICLIILGCQMDSGGAVKL